METNKKKLPKFIIGKNKMVSDSEYVAHTRNPEFFAEVIKEGKTFKLEPDRLVDSKLLDRAKDWYIAHMNYDKNI